MKKANTWHSQGNRRGTERDDRKVAVWHSGKKKQRVFRNGGHYNERDDY